MLSIIIKFFQTFEEWSNSIPDFKWLNDYLPDSQQIDKMRVSLLSFKDKIKDNVEMGKSVVVYIVIFFHDIYEILKFNYVPM